MARVLVVLALLAGCGRIGFDASSGDRDGGIDGDAPLPVGRWQSAAISNVAGCGVTTGGELWCWGQGFAGQLGTGDTPPVAPPTRVGAASDWMQASAYGDNSCGTRNDGTLWCWGSNYLGALGAGVANQPYDTPQQVSAGSTWKLVDTGSYRACAIRTDDTLWCWGSNAEGQLGIGSMTDQPRPVQVGTATWSTVALGYSVSCGIQTNGSAWCWGNNFVGQVGDGTTMLRLNPVPVMSALTWSAIDAGLDHVCALEATTGVAWCWGRNYEGELGDGTVASRMSPTRVTSPKLALLTTGNTHTCATSVTGELWCWGEASRGRLSGIDAIDVRSPQKIDAPPATRVFAGGTSTCVIDDASHLFCTGGNSSGQTGLLAGEVHALERADTRTDWRSIYAQGATACGLLTDGHAMCWGLGTTGQLGDGARIDRKSPVAAGAVAFDELEVGPILTVGLVGTTGYQWGYDPQLDVVNDTPQARGAARSVALGLDHACLVDVNGALGCLGGNAHGQLGDGTTTSSTTVLVAVAGSWDLVAAWEEVTCGIASVSGTMQCWGKGARTGTGNAGDVLSPSIVPAIGVPVTRVEFGTNSGCALARSGELWCWGENSHGQVGDGSVLVRLAPVRVGTRADWRDVDGGDLHTCAIPADGTLWCWGHSDQGQLGQHPSDAYVPLQIGTDADWTDVACGDHFTCAIKSDGTRWCFGVNENGTLGNGRGWVSDLTVVP